MAQFKRINRYRNSESWSDHLAAEGSSLGVQSHEPYQAPSENKHGLKKQANTVKNRQPIKSQPTSNKNQPENVKSTKTKKRRRTKKEVE